MKLTLPIDPAGSIGASDVPVITHQPSVPNEIEADSPHVEPQAHSDYLLVCDAHSTSLCDGRWRFSLETADGTPIFDAEDVESGDLNRLTLLAAVRGLEAIEGAAFVTLLSNNRYLIRSLSDSLPRWRQNDFIWEHFGRRIDVQNADLWRRIDRALSIHRVEACLVSSRLVSAGQFDRDETSTSGLVRRRIDPQTGTAGHPVVPAPKFATRTPSEAAATAEVSSSDDSDDASSDRLRRWLMSSSGSNPVHAQAIISSR